MRMMRGAAAILVSMMAANPALAQTLALDGIWGNPEGCKFAKDGHSENDAYVVLKPDGVESYGTGCEWVQVFAAKSGVQVAIGLCGYEGEGGLGSETFVIAPDMADPSKLNISMGPGDPWAVVQKCP